MKVWIEEEAEERTEEKYNCNEKEIMPLEAIGYKKGFKDGAEFGYNKAKVEVEDSYRESLCNSELNLASVTEQLEQTRNLIDQFVNSSPYKTSSAEYFYKDLIKKAKQFLTELPKKWVDNYEDYQNASNDITFSQYPAYRGK